MCRTILNRQNQPYDSTVTLKLIRFITVLFISRVTMLYRHHVVGGKIITNNIYNVFHVINYIWFYVYYDIKKKL